MAGGAPLSLQEYVALTALRAVAKSLNRICAAHESFRNPFIRRLVTSALGVLRECISEIESYDPAAIARESGEEEPSIEHAAKSQARRNDGTLFYDKAGTRLYEVHDQNERRGTSS